MRSESYLRHDELVNLRPLHRLQISGRRRFACNLIYSAGLDAKAIKLGPKRCCCPPGVPIELTSSDPNKLPPRTLKITLAGHILFVAVRPMPFIAVAFDSKAPLHPFDDEVNTVAMIGRVTNAHLRAYMKTPVSNQLKNVALKLGIKPAACSVGRLAARVKHVAQQAMTHTCSAEDI